MNYWIFPSNLGEFDSIVHLENENQVGWRQVKQSQSAKVGDIAFLYIVKENGGDYSQTLAIRTKIIKINKDEYPILLEKVSFFEPPIPLSFLQLIGVVKHDKDYIQSPRVITKEQADKILSYAPKSKEQEMTELELANKLKEMYNSYEKPCGVHLFGIKYADEIMKNDYKVDSIVKQAGIPESYSTEVRKGIKIAEHLPSIDINLTSSLWNQRPKSNATIKTPPLNQILYGPPGTGKTYSTIDKTLEILRHYDKTIQIPESREAKRAIFDEYRANKQIEFVTFHQSFSYEEFVEGIKPKFVKKSKNLNNDTETKSKEMIYKVKSGIFKKICNRALYKEYQFKSGESEIQADTKTRVWKISIVAKSEKEELRDEVLKHCLEKDEIRIGWSDNGTPERISMLGRNDQSSIYQFENEADIGDIVCVFENANGDIKGIGIIESEFYWDDKADNSEALKLYPRVRKVKWLSNEQINIRDLNGGTNLTQKTFYPLDRVNAIELLNRIGKLDKKDLVADNTQKPFVLIIDEINRGNISKILGELITLIEPSKRIGASDEEKARGIGNESLEVTLPYSNKSFGVPSNLYIIGTMNTADRSIALLDTALRRRFEFVEMMPQWDNEHISTDCNGVNLQTLLKTMNERIEFLLDREHTIGHSFFIGVDSLSELREVFKLKIIPLLQEYFYDDYAKIDAVLGGNGMVEIIETKVSKLFHKKDVDLDLEDKKIYKIKSFEKEEEKKFWDNPQTYTNIYGGNGVDSQNSNEQNKNEQK